MHLLKALFIALFTIAAVVAGAVAAAVVAGIGLLVFSVKRFLGGGPAAPAPRPQQARPYRQPKSSDADVIEVSATEVHR
jgi:hypothetical protein